MPPSPQSLAHTSPPSLLSFSLLSLFCFSPVAALRQRSVSGQVEETQVREFITRLATALHTYGSSAARTATSLEKAARLEVDVGVAVFPSLVLLSFGDGQREFPTR